MKSPHTSTEAHGHPSSATPRLEGTRDVLDILANSIAQTAAREAKPEHQLQVPAVPAEPNRELLTEKMLADRWVCSVARLGVHLISVQKVTVRASPQSEDWRGVCSRGERKCLSRFEFLLVS